MTQTAHKESAKNPRVQHDMWECDKPSLLTSSSISPLNSFAQFVETRLRSVFQFRWFPSWWILCVCWSWNVWQPQGLGEIWLSQAMKVRRITWLAKQEAPTSAMVTGNTLEMEIVARPSGPNAPKEAPTFALAPGSTLATTSAVWPLINKYGSLKWRAVPTFVMVTGRTSATTNVSLPSGQNAPKEAPTFALAPGPTLATTSAVWPLINKYGSLKWRAVPTFVMVTGRTSATTNVSLPSGQNAPKEAPTFALAPGPTLATTSAVWPLINKYGSLKWRAVPTFVMVTGRTSATTNVSLPSGQNAPKEAPTFALAPGPTLATTSAVWPLINKYGSLKWRAVPTFVMVTGRTSAITNVSRPKRPPAPKAAPTFALAPGPTLATTSAAWPQIGSKLKSCPRLQWTQCDTRKALPLVTSLDCVCPWTLCAICWIEFRWFPSWWLLCVCMCLLVTDWITLGWE